MMKRNDFKYSDIASFEDFRNEKERLIFRSKLNEAKLNLTYLKLRDIFSISTHLISVAREVLLPRISDFIGGLISKSDREAS
jgi:hypothetical protein